MRRKGAFIPLFASAKGAVKESREILKSEVAQPSEDQGVCQVAAGPQPMSGNRRKSVFVNLLGGDAAHLVPEELRLA